MQLQKKGCFQQFFIRFCFYVILYGKVLKEIKITEPHKEPKGGSLEITLTKGQEYAKYCFLTIHARKALHLGFLFYKVCPRHSLLERSNMHDSLKEATHRIRCGNTSVQPFPRFLHFPFLSGKVWLVF